MAQLRFVFGAMGLFCFAMALAADTGIWVKAGDPAQVNVGCLQVWHCVPGKDVLHSPTTFVWTTEPTSTVGVCSAGGGAVDSCNVCLANLPTEQCEWELREKD